MNRDTSGRGRAVVDVWLHYYVTPRFLDGTRELAGEFNRAHPDYQVDIHGVDYRALPREVWRAVQQGTTPAVVQYFFTSTQLARDMRTRDGRPLFTPVGPAIAGRHRILGEQVVLDDVLPAARDYYRYDGEILSIPPLASTTLLYANTSVLAAAGVTEVPRTWAGIEAACRAVAALPGGPSHGITWPNHGWIFQQAVAQQGGLLADHDNGRSGRAERVDLASEQMLEFVSFWQRLHRAGHYLYHGLHPGWEGAVTIWADNYAAFAGQRVAFVLSSSVEAENMVQAGRDGGFTVEASRLPHNDALPYAGSLIGGDSLWLADGLDQSVRDGALAFIQFLNSPERAADRHRTSNYLPITTASVRRLEREGWFAEHPHHRVALDQLAVTDGSPAARGALLGNFAGIQDAATRAMHDVLTGGAERRARFAQASGEAQRLLDDYNAGLGDPDQPGPDRFDVG